MTGMKGMGNDAAYIALRNIQYYVILLTKLCYNSCGKYTDYAKLNRMGFFSNGPKPKDTACNLFSF